MNTSPGSARQARKEQKGSTMDIKAISDSTNETIEVTPVALQDIPGYSDYSALAIFDAKTGSPPLSGLQLRLASAARRRGL